MWFPVLNTCIIIILQWYQWSTTLLMWNMLNSTCRIFKKPGTPSGQALTILFPGLTGYTYVKLCLKRCCSFVCRYRKLVRSRLVPIIPSAVCSATLGACQGDSVSNQPVLLSQADNELARRAVLAWCSHSWKCKGNLAGLACWKSPNKLRWKTASGDIAYHVFI